MRSVGGSALFEQCNYDNASTLVDILVDSREWYTPDNRIQRISLPYRRI